MNSLKWLPNAITFLRIVLVAPFLYCVLTGKYQVAFYLFMLAGFSDGLDGLLARQFNWTSRLGALVDPIADKLLMILSFGALAYLQALPVWLFVVVLSRDAIIVAGFLTASVLVKGGVNSEPNRVSKLNTVLQVLVLFVALFELAYWPLLTHWMPFLLGCLILTSVLSVLIYIWEGCRLVWADR